MKMNIEIEITFYITMYKIVIDYQFNINNIIVRRSIAIDNGPLIGLKPYQSYVNTIN